MATNNDNTFINSFNKGMNTDTSYSNIQEGCYLYAENIRNYSLNKSNSNSATNTGGAVKPIEGYKTALTISFNKYIDDNTIKFKISNILATTIIRQYGIIIAEDKDGNWVVIRFTNKIGTSGEFNEIDDCKIIFRSYNPHKNSGSGETASYNQLSGNRVSIVSTWETEDNIKIYIADGQHFMKIINIAPHDDDYNSKNSGHVELFNQFPNVTTKPIIFCGLTFGQLGAGNVQYAYRFYKKRGNVSQMSVPTRPIPLGVGYTDTDTISKKSKGSLQQDIVNCGVKLKIPLDNDNLQLDHILIYRIFHYKNGQTPEISLIYDRAIQIQGSEENPYMSFTDNGQEAIQQLTLDEYNNISGIYIIPKVIESKNDILFAANIKDDQSTLDDIGRLFDARAFRANRVGNVVLENGNTTINENLNEFLSKREKSETRLNDDVNDQFNPYNDINKRFKQSDDVCKFLIDGDKKYYGGTGQYISWKFVIAKVVGDYSYSENNQFGSKHIGIDYTYNKDYAAWSKCTNTPQLYTIYEKDNVNHVESAGKADFTRLFEPNNDNGTYANPCVTYSLRSLRRDELYRYAIILYNKKGQHTPALWIDDIRTPSFTESQFQTFCANGKHIDKDEIGDISDKEWKNDNVELTVFPLGIQFNVDIDRFNQKLLRERPEEYENIKIVNYEILRCHRDQSDIQTIAQGVLSRPIKRNTNPQDYSVVNDVYTPSGSVTTQQFWTGELWQANNSFYHTGSSNEQAGLPEGDNFSNRTFYQFMCPECVYNKDSFKQLVENTHSYLSPLSYIFGHCAGTDALDYKKGYGNATYPQLMRSFEAKIAGDTGFKPPCVYNYIGSSVCGHNLALPQKAWSEYVKQSMPLCKDYAYGMPDNDKTNSEGYYSKDIYYNDIGSENFRNALTSRMIPNEEDYITDYDKDNGTDRVYLQGLQLMYIDQAYSRNGVSYYNAYPWHVNKYFGIDVGNNETEPSRGPYKDQGVATYKTISANDIQLRTWNTQTKLQNFVNKNILGYTKLYESSNIVILRNYKNDECESVKKFGLPYTYDTIDLDDITDLYEVSNSKAFQQIQWSELIDSTAVDNKKSFSAKYIDHVESVGTKQFCNVIESGTYDDNIRTLTTDNAYGWFNDSANKSRLYDIRSRAAIFGTGGSCVMLNLDSEKNILYKNICTNFVNRPFCGLSKKKEASLYSIEDYDLNQALMEKIPTDRGYPVTVTSIDPYKAWSGGSAYGEEYKPTTNNYFNGDAYDYVDYIVDKTTGEHVPIYRSSISGTYLCNLRQSTIPYGGYSYSARCLNQYVSFGDINDANITKMDVFDGDCYIQPFEYQSCHKTYHKDMPLTVTAGLFYSIPVETNINIAYTSGVELSRQGTNEASNLQEDPANMLNMWVQEKPEYEYNTVYSVQPKTHSVEASDLSDDSNTVNSVDYRCWYSDSKTNNENYDNWAVFKAANFLDADDRYGQITNLRSFNNILLFWQERAIGQFSVNERTQISDNSGKPLVLGTGGILERYDYFDIMSGMRREQYCDVSTSKTIYWYDDTNNEIKALNGNQPSSISKQCGIQSLMNERNGVHNPVLFYDYKYNEIVSQVLRRDNDESVCYNENIGAFTSVYTTQFNDKLQFENGVYLTDINDGSLNINQWNVQNGEIGDTILRYVVNAQPLITKVFDNQEIVTENPILEQQYSTFDFTWTTDLMSTSKPISTTGREGNFRYAVPRSGNELYGNRMRGKYMICEMVGPSIFLNGSKFRDVSISYIITKFRRSCS